MPGLLDGIQDPNRDNPILRHFDDVQVGANGEIRLRRNPQTRAQAVQTGLTSASLLGDLVNPAAPSQGVIPPPPAGGGGSLAPAVYPTNDVATNSLLQAPPPPGMDFGGVMLPDPLFPGATNAPIDTSPLGPGDFPPPPPPGLGEVADGLPDPLPQGEVDPELAAQQADQMYGEVSRQIDQVWDTLDEAEQARVAGEAVQDADDAIVDAQGNPTPENTQAAMDRMQQFLAVHERTSEERFQRRVQMIERVTERRDATRRQYVNDAVGTLQNLYERQQRRAYMSAAGALIGGIIGAARGSDTAIEASLKSFNDTQRLLFETERDNVAAQLAIEQMALDEGLSNEDLLKIANEAGSLSDFMALYNNFDPRRDALMDSELERSQAGTRSQNASAALAEERAQTERETRPIAIEAARADLEDTETGSGLREISSSDVSAFADEIGQGFTQMTQPAFTGGSPVETPIDADKPEFVHRIEAINQGIAARPELFQEPQIRGALQRRYDELIRGMPVDERRGVREPEVRRIRSVLNQISDSTFDQGQPIPPEDLPILAEMLAQDAHTNRATGETTLAAVEDLLAQGKTEEAHDAVVALLAAEGATINGFGVDDPNAFASLY